MCHTVDRKGDINQILEWNLSKVSVHFEEEKTPFTFLVPCFSEDFVKTKKLQDKNFQDDRNNDNYVYLNKLFFLLYIHR